MQCCTNETVVGFRKWIGCRIAAVVALSTTALGGCTSRITYLADGSRGICRQLRRFHAELGDVSEKSRPVVS